MSQRAFPGIEPGQTQEPPPAPREKSRQKLQALQALKAFYDRFNEITHGLEHSIAAEWIVDELKAGRLRMREFNAQLLLECVADLFPRRTTDQVRAGVLQLCRTIQYCYDQKCYLAASRKNLAELTGLKVSTLDWWLRRLKRFGVLQVSPTFRRPSSTRATHSQYPNLYYGDLFLNGVYRADLAPDWTPRKRVRTTVTPEQARAEREVSLGAIRTSQEKISENERLLTSRPYPGRGIDPGAAGARSQRQAPPPATTTATTVADVAPVGRHRGPDQEPRRVAAGAAQQPQKASKERVSKSSRTDGRNGRVDGRSVYVHGKSFARSVAESIDSPLEPRPSRASTPLGALDELRGRKVAPPSARVERELARREEWRRLVRAVVVGNGGAWFEWGALEARVRDELELAFADDELPDAVGVVLLEHLRRGGL